MIRFFTALFAALLLPVAVAATEIEEASLRFDIMVDGPIIHLSDILEGSQRAETIQVARSPRPGEAVSLNPVAILRLAARYRIRWTPPLDLKRIQVRRASQVVDAALLRSEIEMALADAAEGEDLDIQFSGRGAVLHVPASAEPTVQVISMSYDARSGRFTALVAAPAGDPTGARHRIAGRAWPMVEVPVLAERLRPGSEIEAHHLAWQRVRADRVRRNTVTDEAELLGMSPKRTIVPNRPVRRTDLKRPVMIGKGDIVTMVFRSGGLTLTATGRAIEDGGRNGVIRVLNQRSRLTVEGRIVAPGRVVVGEPVPQLSMLDN